MKRLTTEKKKMELAKPIPVHIRETKNVRTTDAKSARNVRKDLFKSEKLKNVPAKEPLI